MTHSVLSKGIWPVERVILAYIAFTFLLMFCWWNSLVDPLLLFLTRGKALLLMAVMWAVYRWRPCRLTHLLRVSGLMLTLSLFYPDTYEINRMLPNLDHIFAGIEQLLFNCQPSLLFSQYCPWGWLSELMCLGYVSYFPLMAVILLYYFFRAPTRLLQAYSPI